MNVKNPVSITICDDASGRTKTVHVYTLSVEEIFSTVKTAIENHVKNKSTQATHTK